LIGNKSKFNATIIKPNTSLEQITKIITNNVTVL
jgi:hypothetical protein